MYSQLFGVRSIAGKERDAGEKLDKADQACCVGCLALQSDQFQCFLFPLSCHTLGAEVCVPDIDQEPVQPFQKPAFVLVAFTGDHLALEGGEVE